MLEARQALQTGARYIFFYIITPKQFSVSVGYKYAVFTHQPSYHNYDVASPVLGAKS